MNQCTEPKPIDIDHSCNANSCSGGLWSNVFANIKAGSEISIPPCVEVVLDTSPPPLKKLYIPRTSKLTVQDGKQSPIVLQADWIHIEGALEANLVDRHFKIRLTASFSSPPPRAEDAKAASNLKALHVDFGGVFNVSGRAATSWVRLSRTAEAGDSTIVVDNDVSSWRAGDEIIVVNTDFFDRYRDLTERRTIKKVTVTAQTSEVTLSKPLKYMHYGQLQVFAGRTVDERAEVGLLTHNVVIEGSEQYVELLKFGGHTIATSGSAFIANNIEFRRLGQMGRLGRYPVHLHLLERGGVHSSVTHCSIHSTLSRAVTIHRTSGS